VIDPPEPPLPASAPLEDRIAQISRMLKRSDVPHIIRIKLVSDRIDLQKALAGATKVIPAST
jgi:hypothetical protein